MDPRLLCLCALLAIPPAFAAEEFSFDLEAFEKKPFELGGYAELRAERLALDPDSALYQLNLFDRAAPAHLERTAGVIELSGLYRAGIATFQATAHAESASDELGHEDRTQLYEGYVTLAPETGSRLEAGKRVLRWGKGYAFNPVAFVERPKDPNDPELAREGFVVLGGGVTRSLAGQLAAVSFAPVLVPTNDHINEDFGPGDHWNPAARLSLLYRDTDIDFLVLGEGARSARYGVALSRNLGTNVEIHGEWARVTDAVRPVLDGAGTLSLQTGDADSWLLGVRYLNRYDVTTILEYYYNGAGYTEAQMRDYFAFVHDAYEGFAATGDSAALVRARSVQSAYQRPAPMRRYLYLRSSWKEPFDVLYFTPALTVIANLDDGSYSVAPELLYTGVTDLELRLRVFVLNGDRLTDFGEKQSDRRIELRARYYF